jgi:hypothetical protein
MASEFLGAISAVSGSGGAAAKTRTMELLPKGAEGAAKPSADLQVRFSQAMGGVQAPTAVQAPSETMKTMFNTLDKVNNQAKSVSDYATSAELSGGQLTPGEIVQLTMRCNEFMFQCQLTSNIANRSSDGVQQLFRQQG